MGNFPVLVECIKRLNQIYNAVERVIILFMNTGEIVGLGSAGIGQSIIYAQRYLECIVAHPFMSDRTPSSVTLNHLHKLILQSF